MISAEHYAEAENRLRAADYKWQDSNDVVSAIGALYEATMAQANATLALAAAQGANRCPGRDTYAQRCHLEAGHGGRHSIPLPAAEKAWSV